MREAAGRLASHSQAAPDDPLVLREAGAFHYRKGDMGRADGLLSKAMRIDPKDYMAAFFYARMLDETNRQAQAVSYYKQVLRYVPEDAEVHEAYARSLGKTGNTPDAYIHMAYSAIYSHNKKLAERYFNEAKSMSARTTDKTAFKRLETVYKERKEIWDKN